MEIKHANDLLGPQLHPRLRLLLEMVIHKRAIDAGSLFERQVGLRIRR